MYPTQCTKVYDRIVPGDLAPTHIRCTYIAGHDARCSFETLKVVDDAERASSPAPMSVILPTDLAMVLAKIRRGELDEFLELLLSAGHNRKHARRGTTGFARGA